MKKQTAVEWLAEQLWRHHIKIDIKNTVVFQQAKAMEKKQIEEAYYDGGDDMCPNGIAGGKKAERYYNETYGQ